MKTQIARMIVCSAALLPFPQVQAAGPAGKLFGGFAPLKSFTLTVSSITTSKTEGVKVIPHPPVPPGVPEFTVKQKVKFTIGPKGQLKGPGFSLPLKSATRARNSYVLKGKPPLFLPDVGSVAKNSTTGKPFAADLYFVRTKIVTAGLSKYQISYVFE